MKVCVVQPPYNKADPRLDKTICWEIKSLEGCDSSMDLIVLPEEIEFNDQKNDEEKQTELLDKCAQTARRCNAIVCVNAKRPAGKGLRNTTFIFDRSGNLAGKYYKQHLTSKETTYLDSSYTYEYEPVPIVTIDGIRFAFLTCYDFYFYEYFGCIALEKPDIIIGCSLQRTDPHNIIRLITQYCAYNTNAYVVRSSVSLGEDSDVGGCSMVVSPDSSILLDMGNKVGTAMAEIDPKKKYYKSGGFGNPPCSHFEYMEKGRRPWKYRPARAGGLYGKQH